LLKLSDPYQHGGGGGVRKEVDVDVLAT